MKTITLFIALIISNFGFSQIISTSIDIKETNSTHIVEGTIVSQNSFIEKGAIKTDYTLQISNIIKGVINNSTIQIRTLGGQVDGLKTEVCPSDEIEVGLKAKFLLNKKNDYFETSYLGQSVYNREFSEEEEIMKDTILSRNTQNTNVVINTISPSEIIIGNNDVLTITGSGFGATGPTNATKVWVKTLDGANFYALQDPFFYESWSDTEIKVKIPSSNPSASFNEGLTIRLGGGPVRVGSLTSFVQSSNSYEVKGVVRDAISINSGNNNPVTLPALQNGGIKFTPHTNFTNSIALNTLNYAIDNWVCNTGIKMNVDNTQTTTAMNIQNDGISSLYFDSTLSSSVLGRVISTVGACTATGRRYIVDIDFAINPNANFNYSLSSSAPSEIDFYSVVLHELGHVRNMLHVNNPNKVMHSSLTFGQSKRTLHQHEIETGLWIQNDSQNNQTCNKPLMTPGTCLNLSNESFQSFDVEIYPNPTKDFVTINSLVDTIKVYNSIGQEVFTKSYQQQNQTKVDFSSFSNGVYFMKIKTDNLEKTVKIIKQ
jgi:hypothetical protein